MKYRYYLLIVLLIISLTGFTQITRQQARPIDSTLVFEYLQAGNFHTQNYHALPDGGVFTWDAGNGLNTAIEEYNVAWSHTGQVAVDTAEAINNMAGQAYRLFDLETMPNADAYKDSVELWLGSLGIPVSISEIYMTGFYVYPNPLQANSILNITCPIDGNYVLTIVNISGETVFKTSGLANKHQKQSFALTRLKQGNYILSFEINKQLFTTQLIK